MYGFGKSEEFLGEFMKATGSSPIIATKYAPQPWRLTQGSVPAACKASLERLQLQQMGLYIQHWPGFFFNAFSNDAYLQGLADCVDQVSPGHCSDTIQMITPRSDVVGGVGDDSGGSGQDSRKPVQLADRVVQTPPRTTVES